MRCIEQNRGRNARHHSVQYVRTSKNFGGGNGVTGDPCKIAVRGFDSLHLHQNNGLRGVCQETRCHLLEGTITAGSSPVKSTKLQWLCLSFR